MPRRLKNTRAQKDTVIGFDSPDDFTLDQPLSLTGGPLFLTPTPAGVPGAIFTLPALPASRSYVITFSAELDGSESPDTVTGGIYDGVPASRIVTFHQTVGATEEQVVSWSVKLVGNGAVRTVGLSLSSVGTNLVTVPAGGCTGVVTFW
jgi:hypothetical protein